MKFYVGHLVFRDSTISNTLTVFEETYQIAYTRLALLAIDRGAVSAEVEERPTSDAYLFDRHPDRQSADIVEHKPRLN